MAQADDFTNPTTYIIDAENAAEMARLTTQDRIVTRSMGGLFPPELDMTPLHDILDIACGPGGWALDVAKAYPDKRVTGIDISKIMTEYARYQAGKQNISNAQFVVMDALKPLDLPDQAFDFVNARMIGTFVPKKVWPQLVRECGRITRPGGFIRFTESETVVSTSYGAERFSEIAAKAVHKAGLSFSPTGWQIGTTAMLRTLLLNAGCEHIQQRAFVIDCSAGTEEHLNQYQNMLAAGKLVQPFYVRLGVTTAAEIESLYQQVLEEMMSPDYRALWYFLSAWGQKPH